MAEAGNLQGADFDWRSSPLFNFCESSDWELFRGYAELCDKSAGSEVWCEGESLNLLICVVTGSLEAVKKTPGWGKPIILVEFMPGATVGELVFDEAKEHSTTLKVVEDAQLLILRPQAAASLLSDFPETSAKLWRGAALLQQLRLRQANYRLATLF